LNRLVWSHFQDLRVHPRYRHCHNRVFIEANMGFVETDRWAKMLLDKDVFGDVDVMRFDPNSKKDQRGRFGVWTTHDAKMAYASELSRAINKIQLAEFHIGGQTWAKNVDDLYTQLGQFRRDVIQPTNGGNGGSLHNKISISGKGPGQQDDIVMALGIALCYMYKSLADYRFLDMCEQRGFAAS